MQTVAYKIIPSPDKNSISYSKNYRIFSPGEPLEEAVKIVGFSDDVELGSADEAYLIRRLRYSTDRANWSLWYEFTPGDLGDLLTVELGGGNAFFEVKYEYDDSTYNSISTPLKVNEAKVKVTSTKVSSDLFTPTVYCSSERCPVVIADREASFNPYDIGTAVGIAKELSLPVSYTHLTLPTKA